MFALKKNCEEKKKKASRILSYYFIIRIRTLNFLLIFCYKIICFGIISKRINLNYLKVKLIFPLHIRVQAVHGTQINTIERKQFLNNKEITIRFFSLFIIITSIIKVHKTIPI